MQGKNNRKTQRLPENTGKINFNEAVEKDKPLIIRPDEPETKRKFTLFGSKKGESKSVKVKSS